MKIKRLAVSISCENCHLISVLINAVPCACQRVIPISIRYVSIGCAFIKLNSAEGFLVPAPCYGLVVLCRENERLKGFRGCSMEGVPSVAVIVIDIGQRQMPNHVAVRV